MTDPEAIAHDAAADKAQDRHAGSGRKPVIRLGPGLITGVADDDPSGIATYSQAGAQFGLNMLWTMPLCYPFMAAIQLVCARIGRVTGRGIAANMKAVFPVPVVAVVVGLLLVANTLNIAADVAAMGEVAELVTGAPRHVMTVVFVILMAGLQIAIPYHRYVSILKWLTLSLLAYAAVLFAVHVPWGEVLARTFLPRLTFDAQAAAMIVAIFGTTISPYLFFWQASEEVEDMQHLAGARPLLDDPAAAPAELRRISWDTWSGMFYSNVTAWFIILACGVTLHASGVTDIQTAAEAADALRPLAGDMAFLLFALGILGVGLIGVPTLAGSAAYGLAEAMGWQWGLERSANDARGFYGVIFISMALGIVIQFSPINPMKALFWSAVINGVVAVPLMAAILVMAARRSVMGQFTAGRGALALGWMATAIMAAASLWMFWAD
ncbi:MAG: NRAMP family divalent metal transporter [Novosphingobium sp.]